MKKTSIAYCMLTLSAFSIATSIHAQTVLVADNFDTDSGGLSGNNNVTPVGGAPWTGNSIQVIPPDYTSGQVAADYTGNGNVGDLVPLNIVNGGVVTENVDLYMSSAGYSVQQNPVYIGFGTGGAGSLNNGNASSFQWSGSALDVQINELGNGALQWNGNDIANISASGFQPNQQNPIALSYNTFNQQVTVSVDGTQVASGTLSSPVSLNYAGFSEFYGVGFNTSGGYDEATSFDNFSVVQAVPEPSAWPLFASGLGAMAIFRRRLST